MHMSERRSFWFAIALLGMWAVLAMPPGAEAALLAEGSGTLEDVGDTIGGGMVIDGVSLDYALTLAAADLTGGIEWNGTGRSVPNGLSWDDGKSGGARWTVELALSRPVNFVFSQVGQAGLANEPQSVWTIDWDSTGPTSISDPDAQLTDPVTSTGPGTATFSSEQRLFNNAATWAVAGPDCSLYTIEWQNFESSGIGTDAFGIDGDLSQAPTVPAVPEPGVLSILGIGLMLLGLGRPAFLAAVGRCSRG